MTRPDRPAHSKRYDTSNIPSASGSFPALRIVRKGRRRSRIRRALAAVLALVAMLALVGLVVIGRPPAARWARAAADRELRLSLEPGEQVESEAYISQRYVVDYLRETHGVLAGTDRRLLFIGVRPGGLPEASDEPPAFDVRAFPYDTLTSIARSLVFFGRASGITIRGVGRRESFGVDADQWERVNNVARALTVRGQQIRGAVAHEALVQRMIAARPDVREFYEVKRGDALISIARTYNLTPDSLQRLNDLPDERVRIGQRLLVRVYRDLSRPPGM